VAETVVAPLPPDATCQYLGLSDYKKMIKCRGNTEIKQEAMATQVWLS